MEKMKVTMAPVARSVRALNPEARQIACAFEKLDITPDSRNTLQSRYVPYVNWLEKHTARTRLAHYALRIPALLAGILVSSLAALSTDVDSLRWATVSLGLVVAVTIALDGFFNLRERWLHYRRAAETLKSEAWRFIGLAAPYTDGTHEIHFARFVDRMERLIVEEVGMYIQGVAKERRS